MLHHIGNTHTHSNAFEERIQKMCIIYTKYIKFEAIIRGICLNDREEKM